jgi:deoxyguanosine kinase
LYFLTSRLRQLEPDMLRAGQIAISDYVFDKELIYAKRLLDPQQLAVYEQVYQPLAAKAVCPVLVIYLQDSVQNCLQRIHKRNRPYEQRIEIEFLETLSLDYDRLFTDWKSSPVIRISISEFDPVCGSDIRYLGNQIRSYVVTQINTL